MIKLLSAKISFVFFGPFTKNYALYEIISFILSLNFILIIEKNLFKKKENYLLGCKFIT